MDMIVKVGCLLASGLVEHQLDDGSLSPLDGRHPVLWSPRAGTHEQDGVGLSPNAFALAVCSDPLREAVSGVFEREDHLSLRWVAIAGLTRG